MLRQTILALGLTLTAGAVWAADPVEGTWKTQPGDTGSFAYVNITTCGDTICGTMGQAFDAAGNKAPSEFTGRQMIWDMEPRGGGEYRGGKIWAPDRDRTYNSRMTLKGNSLEVKGCVLGICRGQTWTRVQ